MAKLSQEKVSLKDDFQDNKKFWVKKQKETAFDKKWNGVSQGQM